MTLRIGHFADLHVRGLSRHDEIRAAIIALCEDGKRRKLNHIVIAGDIWHTKSAGITAEYIDLMTWAFRTLADVAPVHIVLGNHDGMLTNLTRQDAISPIVDALNDSRVKVYKKSGVYPIESNVNLCVYSVFDHETWNDVKPIKGQYNIACYHGSVAGATTDDDWLLKADVSVSWFDDLGYDLVMLGDIHKMQHLGYREFDE